MKTKKAAIIGAIIVVILGLGFWWFFGHQSKPVSNTHTSVSRDTTAPSIQLNIPGSSLEIAKGQQTIEVSANASDNQLVTKVEYALDDKVVARSIEAPFTVTINIAKLTPGTHVLQATAYDAAGNSAKSKPFAFTIADSGDVTPSGDDSKATVQGSVKQSARRTSGGVSVANSSSNSGDNSGDGTSDNTDGNTDNPERTSGGWYATLPKSLQVCSNNEWNNGPGSAPADSVVVPAGDNTGFSFSQDNKTYWFAPGTHNLGTGQYSTITPGNGSTYIGAPGAILDGQMHNQYAFSGNASNVRIAYLDIRNFGRGNDNNNEGVINHDSGTGWTMEYLNARYNDGAAVFIGSQNILRNSCLKDNGQYGFSMYKPQVEGDSAIKDIVLDHNEITGNNQDDWESQINGCGCTGGGKFWDVKGATVTSNYVHDNLSTGLWADTNNIDFLFDSNWIDHNEGEGIWYEISYNATMSRNVIRRNAWTTGGHNQGSPAPAIYISESGGDSRLQSSTSGSASLRIKNNLLDDNFSGVSIFENSNRFCNSNGNTSKTYCTPFITPSIIPAPYDYVYPNPTNATHPCYTNIAQASFTADCRWHSKNVQVSNNEFRFDTANVPCAGTFCGVQALFATGDNNIPWAPAAYNIANVQNDVMFNNNNKFFNNTYVGDWRFAKGYGETVYFGTWQAAPYLQDAGSIFDGQTTAPPVANALDVNTATLEGAIGQWTGWYSADATQSTEAAHSGTHSLKVGVTSSGGWALQLANWPGYATTPGNKRLTYWAKQGTGAISSATLRVKWFDGSKQLIQTDLVPISSLTASWQKGSADVTAPAGATTVFVELYSGSGSIGDTIFADDFIIADLP